MELYQRRQAPVRAVVPVIIYLLLHRYVSYKADSDIKIVWDFQITQIIFFRSSRESYLPPVWLEEVRISVPLSTELTSHLSD
jgi:hypothetical protein